MGALTGVVLAAVLAYIGGWLAGLWAGNFAAMLMTLTLITGAYWLAEWRVFAPRRRAAAAALELQVVERQKNLARQGIAAPVTDLAHAKAQVLAQPWWLDWTAGLFPVIAVVFLLRSFLFEPFKIPSGSMIPTLLVGDLILVNKYHYGIRLPVINQKILSLNEPKRGDVMVFRYPENPSVDFIKRVVGLPGDEVSYLNKQLRLNGKLVSETPQTAFYDVDSMRYAPQFSEKLGAVEHLMLEDNDRPAQIPEPGPDAFAFRDQCRYNAEGVVCKVPAGHYFMMGDNRDNSQDSRFWGFVPDQNIVGKAFMVWMNFGDLKRVGTFFK